VAAQATAWGEPGEGRQGRTAGSLVPLDRATQGAERHRDTRMPESQSRVESEAAVGLITAELDHQMDILNLAVFP